ncbi:hypothetical protein [Rhodococcus sp. IEGM1428]|uniref:hypothetical protein n=1 Tax=Rhodococcus sp. IEGM1428 TaxID=3392191 RepID=UPI003D0B6201
MKTNVRVIAPHLRLTALEAVCDSISGQDLVSYFHDRRSTVDLPIDQESDMLALLRTVAERPPRAIDLAQDILTVVYCMSTWDALFRSMEVYRGNVYIAGDEQIEKLLRAAGVGITTDLTGPGGILDVAQSLELLYRFPVALKFTGHYSMRTQLRVNGWGRELAATAPILPSLRDVRDRLQAVIVEHQSSYGSLLADLSENSLEPPNKEGILPRADLLPVAVLI